MHMYIQLYIGMVNYMKIVQQERINIFQNVSDSIIPKRVPVNFNLPIEFIAQFGGMDMVAAQWKPSSVEEAADKACRDIYSDICPFNGSIRYPSFYQTLESQSFVMGSNGFIQHPEVVGMDPADYDYLIEKPYDCLLERILPRQYKALDLNDPVKMALSMTKSMLAFNNDFAESGVIKAKLVDKYGYYPGVPSGFTSAPFDFISDQLRGFKDMSMDIRRMPEKVAEACEAIYPIVFKKGLPKVRTKYSYVYAPLHMPPFMREKDFVKLWWPTFKRMCDEYASMGIHMTLFCEQDWTRYLDYLYELPTNTTLWFEYGDPQLFKDKLGKKHIISGFYPVTMLKSHTKEQCVDKAKELIDILAPGGKYVFNVDKKPLTLTDVNVDNLCAVMECVRDYGAYTNHGESCGPEFDKEDYKVDPSASRKLDSKYYLTGEKYQAQHPEVSDCGEQKLQGFEEKLFDFLVYLFL